MSRFFYQNLLHRDTYFNLSQTVTSVQPYGKEASDFTKSQLEGKQIWIEKDVQERDNYGHLLAYAWTAPPVEVTDKEIRDKMFNAKLLLDGYAQLLTIAPDVKYVDYFTVYQKEARESSKGLWGITVKNNATAASSSSSGTTVYVTKTGSKYHRDGCRTLKSKIPISLDKAKASYEPCKVCNPPR